MNTTRFIILTVLVVSTLIISGCTLSASTPPPVSASETPDDAMSTLEAELGNIATQTGAAGGEVESVPTQEPPVEATDITATEVPPVAPPENTEPPPAPTQTPVPVAKPTAGVPKTYVLQEGEFPYCIARRFNVDVNELLTINGLTEYSLLQIGYTLNIPQSGNKFIGKRALLNHPTNYSVVAGDTIYSIACKYGNVDPLAIAQANGLSSPYTLSSGQSIHIP